MNESVEIYLQPTEIIDAHHSSIKRYAERLVKDAGENPIEQAVNLYYGVRDGIWYDPYYPFYLPEHYRASNVLKNKRGYCVCKASLLCALGRAINIPSRVGFATVKNHLATRELIQYIGSDLFVFHGYTEFLLNEKWVKATPAFNIELCHKHHVEPLEFNGRQDSIFHAYNLDNKQFMEYIDDHGVYADIPVETIVAAWEKAYGVSRVRRWIRSFETQEKVDRNFYQETVVKNP
jgi:transglutaminase-like putative cysteine protease